MKQKAKVLFYTKETEIVHILLGKRTSGGDTFWWLPGGSIEEGEDPFQALIRELEEELTLGKTIRKVLEKYLQSGELPKQLRYVTPNAEYMVFMVQVPVVVINEKIEIVEEFDEVNWFDFSQMPGNMSREYEILKPLLNF